MKQITGKIYGVATGLFLALPLFAYPNPYVMFGSDDSNPSQTNGVSSMQSVSDDASSAAPSSTAPATSTTSTPSQTATMQYQTPKALVQPAANVGTSSTASTATSAPKPLQMVQTMSSLNPSVSLNAPAGTTLNTAPANYSMPGNYSTTAAAASTTDGTIVPVPSSNGSNILQQIDKDIQSSNQQIANRFATDDARDYPTPTPTSLNTNLLQTDSGFPALMSGFVGNQLVSATSSVASSASSGANILNPLTGVPVATANLNALYQAQTAATAAGSVQPPATITLLNNAVLSPFSGNWSADISSASTPQLLRIIAMQQAIQNYILYQQLNRMSEQEGLQIQALQSNVLTSQILQTIQQNEVKNGLYLKQMTALLQGAVKNKN